MYGVGRFVYSPWLRRGTVPERSFAYIQLKTALDYNRSCEELLAEERMTCFNTEANASM
jgi:hypothetical protein